jgi:hypothetical protein
VPLLNCTIWALTASTGTPVATGVPATATAEPDVVVEAAAEPAGRVPATALAPAAVVPGGACVAAAALLAAVVGAAVAADGLAALGLVVGAAADAAARVAAVVGAVVAKGVAVAPFPPQASSSVVAAASVPRAAVARIRKSRRPIAPAYHAAISDWTSGFSSVGDAGGGETVVATEIPPSVKPLSGQECTVAALSLSTPEIAVWMTGRFDVRSSMFEAGLGIFIELRTSNIELRTSLCYAHTQRMARN